MERVNQIPRKSMDFRETRRGSNVGNKVPRRLPRHKATSRRSLQLLQPSDCHAPNDSCPINIAHAMSTPNIER